MDPHFSSKFTPMLDRHNSSTFNMSKPAQKRAIDSAISSSPHPLYTLTLTYSTTQRPWYLDNCADELTAAFVADRRHVALYRCEQSADGVLFKAAIAVDHGFPIDAFPARQDFVDRFLSFYAAFRLQS